MNPRKAFEQALVKQAVGNKEYVIWGTPPGGHDEVILLTKFRGEIIKDKNLAKKLADWCETEQGAKKVRIQELDITGEFDWMRDIGMNPRKAFEQVIAQIQKQALVDNRDWTLARRQSYLYEEFLRQVKEELVGMEPEAGRKVKLSWIHRGQGFPRIHAELVAVDGSKKRAIFLPETPFQAASTILYEYGGY
jgi:hypothetical protein